jgi:hypothetical protein
MDPAYAAALVDRDGLLYEEEVLTTVTDAYPLRAVDSRSTVGTGQASLPSPFGQ